ncbi:MAG: redoxin domain-containing protein [Gammaproteobacteria bacterium]|nr:redoxin domain-containing protein [Gammaproteobacteria bacterium]MDP2141174.1 redoxin domain-containing protein [Gammaproteobacteria bacterium]MDP2349152.1 redoxin domain-containing protein [Gammaproteobacteria bacterium]
MKRFNWLVISLLATAMNSTGYAATERSGDFSLTDHNGTNHQLSRYRHKSALVLVAQSNICAIPPHASSQLQTLRNNWEGKGVAFMMINGAGEESSGIQMKARTQRIELPILVDADQAVTRTLNLTKSGEIVVLDPEDFSVLYRGPFDPKLDATLNNVAAGVKQDTVVVPATGCNLSFPSVSVRSIHVPGTTPEQG